MHENKNTEQGIRHHDKANLPKPVLNNEQDPNSIKDPLKAEIEKTQRIEKENNEKIRKGEER